MGKLSDFPPLAANNLECHLYFTLLVKDKQFFSFLQLAFSPRGLPYMTAVGGGGGPRKTDERNKISCFVAVTREEGVKKSENLMDVIYVTPISCRESDLCHRIS